MNPLFNIWEALSTSHRQKFLQARAFVEVWSDLFVPVAHNVPNNETSYVVGMSTSYPKPKKTLIV